MLKQLNLRFQRHSLIRYSLLVLLGAFIIILGHLEPWFKESLVAYVEKLIDLSKKNYNIHESHNKHIEDIINLIYRLFYCIICLYILHIYFMKAQITKLILSFYSLLLCLIMFLYGSAQVLHIEPLQVVAFRIDTLLISPMPIILIIPALYLTNQPK